jgi:hypothetical protein
MARGDDGRGGLLIAEVNGMPTTDHALASFLIEAGFNPSAMGFQMRKPPSVAPLVTAERVPSFMSARRARQSD